MNRRKIQNSIVKAQQALKKMFDSNLIEHISNYEHGIYDAALIMDENSLNVYSKKIIKQWENLINSTDKYNYFYLPGKKTETHDHISHYRFYEYLHSQIGNLSYSNTIDKEMEKTEDWITERACSVFDSFSLTKVQKNIKNHETVGIYGLTDFLWAVSRTIKLRFQLSSFSDIWIKQVKHCRLKKGYWEIKYWTGKKDRIYYSILISLIILRLATKSEDREFVQATVKWLLKQQKDNGEWRNDTEKVHGNNKPNLFVTLLAIELIQRTKPQDSMLHIDKAVNWVIEQQKDNGLWEDQDHGDTFFVTAIVLEILKGFEIFPGNLNNFQHLTRDFMYRSKALSFEEDMQSCKTAAILTGLATEMFLYGCLDKHNIDYTKENGHTIGITDALKKVKRIDNIKKNSDFSTEIEEKVNQSKNIRNNAIHKEINLDKLETIKIINGIYEITSKMSIMIYGYDILK